MENSPPIIPFPHLPVPAIQPIVSQAFPVGARISNYIRDVLKTPAPDPFFENCTLLDNLREQLRTAAEIPPDRLALYVDYVTLLTTLTQGLNIGDDGVGVLYTWAGQTLPSIEFDLCCISFNLVLGLLKIASRYDLTANASLKPAIDAIQAALFIVDKAKEFHRTDFDRAVSGLMLDNLRHHCELDLAMWQAAGLIIGHKSLLIIAKVTQLCSTLCLAVQPNLTDLSRTFSIMATLNYAQSLYSQQEAGRAIGVLRHLESELPDDRAMKKWHKDERAKMVQVKAQVAKLLAEYINANEVIYGFQPIPQTPEAVPSQPNKPIQGKLAWSPTVTPTPYQACLGEAIGAKANERITNYTETSNRALADIATNLELIPTARSDEIQKLLTDLYAQRTLVNELINQISGLLGRKVSQITQKYPNAYTDFHRYRDALTQASQTDLFFETTLGKANCSVDALLAARTQLEDLRGQILEKLELAKQAADAAKAESGNSDPAALAQAIVTMNAQFEKLAGEMNPIFAKVRDTIQVVKTESANTVKSYLSELAIVENGLKQGIQCYTKLLTNLRVLLDQVNSA